MNKNNKFDYDYFLQYLSPIRKCINYLVIGIFFACFFPHYIFIDNEFITGVVIFGINAIITSICFYLGLRLLKKENIYFRLAYISSWILLFITLTIMVLFALPNPYLKKAMLLFIGALLLTIILICFGFQRYMKEKYPIYIITSFILILLLQSQFELSVYTLFCHFLLVIILCCLLYSTKEHIIENEYNYQLAPVRFDAWKFVLYYIIITIVLTGTTLYSFPLINYHYINKTPLQYQHLELLDTCEQEIEDSKIVQYIYDYDKDFYLYVYDFKYIPSIKLSSINLDYSYGLSSRRYAKVNIIDLDVNDGTNHYQTENISTQKQIYDNFFTNSYHIPLNPNIQNINIQLAVKIDKMNDYDRGFDSDLGDNVLNISINKYSQYPYKLPQLQYQFQSISEGNQWSDIHETKTQE